MDIPVIVHRWFEQGAGWTYAPQLEKDIPDIMAALDSHLKAGQPGSFIVRMDQDVCLMGTIADDPDCADPKARPRRPTILRAVLVHGALEPAQEQAVVEALAQTWPVQPGPDPKLVIIIRDDAQDPHPPGSRQADLGTATEVGTGTRKARRILMATAVIACIVAVASIGQLKGWLSPAPRDADLQDVARAMQEQLSGWGVQVQESQPSQVITRYCGFFSQTETGDLPQQQDHPYLRFVARLPIVPVRPKKFVWTQTEVVEALRDICRSLNAISPPPGSITWPDALLRISHLMEYDAWRQATGPRDPDGVFAEAPGERVARYVERFRKGSGSIPEIALKMRECLRAWNVKEADGAPDFTVLRLFFQSIKRPSARMEGLTEFDRKHAYWKFLNRLPDVPCTAWTPDSDKDVEEGLGELARQLGHRTDNQPVVNLIDAIAREMDYDQWLKKQDPRAMTIKGEPRCEALRSAVSHFRKHSEGDSAAAP